MGGEWLAPVDVEFFDNTSPLDGSHIARVPKSNSKDIGLAVKVTGAWGKTSATERSHIMFKITDRIENNLEHMALVESWDNGKAIREPMAAGIPLAVDHFRYFGSVIRAEAGQVADIGAGTVSMEVAGKV